jgi:nucleotide-binding universal stress UspA family protein
MVAERAAARLESAGFSTRWAANEGDAAIRILEAIEREGYDLAAVGAGGRSWRGAAMLGRVSTNLLHGATCSVLVVHAWPAAGEQPSVLVGTDGSAGAEAAVEAFASFADPARCRVLVVSADKPPAAFAWSDEHASAPDGGPEAERSVARAVAILEERGFDCRTEAVEGHPAEALLRLAERDGCGLVVVGSRGLGALRRMALGSVSDKVARHAAATLVGRKGGGEPG